MQYGGRRFIAFPQFLQLKDIGLKYQDAAVYCALRSFRNDVNNESFPSYETLAEMCKANRKTIMKSVKRLEKSELITVKRKFKESNRYKFMEINDTFERIPYEVFQTPDLTFIELCMLITLRQFFDGGRFSLFTVAKMSKWLQISEDTIRPQLRSLIEKGYVKKVIKGRAPTMYTRFDLTDKIDWVYDYSKGQKQKPAKILIKVG